MPFEYEHMVFEIDGVGSVEYKKSFGIADFCILWVNHWDYWFNERKLMSVTEQDGMVYMDVVLFRQIDFKW